MASSNRPLSPHLQVYQPQITSVLSILHRISGVILAIGSLLLIYWLAAAATSDQAFETAQSVIGSFFGRLFLFGWTIALFFHFCNGIRHLAWDVGLGFELESVTKSGWAVLAGTAILTLLSWIAGYSFMGGA